VKPLERELATMRGFAACRGDDDCLDEAEAELAGLRAIEESAKRAAATIGDLATLVSRLAHAMRKAAPEHELPGLAMEYLRRNGLCGSPLRDSGADD